MASWLTVSVLGVLLSGIGLGVLKLENSKNNGEIVEYESTGWLRECAVWDEENSRFLVSNMEGGIGQISLLHQGFLKEETVVKDLEYLGNSTLGFQIDSLRKRLVVVIADTFGHKHSALAAYDLRTWNRLYLTRLTGPESISLANDVDLDTEGNAYVTDSKMNVIWKVSQDGAIVSVLSSPLFTSQPNKLPFKGFGLNGIVHHPEGYLLVVHTWSGAIFKSSLDGKDVSVVNVSSPMVMGDGLALLSADKLVVAGIPSARLLESRDGWKTAQLTHRYVGPMHRLSTTATIKDGKPFVNHMFGFGLAKRKHVIVEAIFKPLNIPSSGISGFLGV